MSAERYFADCYATARALFLSAAEESGGIIESHVHALPGPDGEALALDSLRLGQRDAANLLVVTSGTHGVEGFCGSAAQVGGLRSGLYRDLPKGVAVLLIHAVNPHGFASLRRVNEDNIDLNRHFVDFEEGVPHNAGYDHLAQSLCPVDWSPDVVEEADGALLDYLEDHGLETLLEAVVGGQYRHPGGLYYGGTAPSWSRRTLGRVLQDQLSGVRQVAFIDVHSGLGDYGYGAPMSSHPFGTEGHARVREWYGEDVTAAGDGEQTFPDNSGDISALFAMTAPDVRMNGICLEFGTRPELEVFHALRRDNWLYVHGDPDSAEGRTIKAEIKDAFYPEERAWREQVWDRAASLQSTALRCLAED